MRKSLSFVLCFVGLEIFAGFHPDLPVYRETALSASLREEIRTKIPERLDTIKCRYDALTKDICETIPKDAFQRIRTEKRMEIAGRLFGFAKREYMRGNTDGFAFAFLAVEDLVRFCDLFEDELRFWKDYPLAPDVNPVVVRVADFGASGDGKSDNTEAFDAAVELARQRNGRPVVIEVPEGEFHFNSGSNRVHVLLRGLTNVVLKGVSPQKTRLRFDRTECSGVVIAGSANVSVMGLELASTEMPFFQGVVESFDKAGGWAIVRRNPRTMRPDDSRFLSGGKMQFCLGIFDAVGNEVVDAWHELFYDRKAEDLGSDRFKIYLQKDHFVYRRSYSRLEPGWQVVIPLRKAFCSNATTSHMSYMCNFVDVWVRNGRSSAINFCSEALYSTAWRVKVFPFEGLLAASCADAIMNHRGTFIGECDFDHLNDDGANAYSLGRRIKRLEGNDTIVTTWLPCNYKAGDVMQVMDAQTGQYLYLGRVKRAGGADGPRGGLQDVQFEDVLPDGIRSADSFKTKQATNEERFRQMVSGAAVDASKEPDQLYRPYMFGVGHVVYRCRFSSLRGSGAVLACPNALIEETTYEYMNRGISLSTLGGSVEGPSPYNVWIKNCTFRHNIIGIEGRCCRPVGGKFITAPIRGLTIEGNRFENVGRSYIDDNIGDDAEIR